MRGFRKRATRGQLSGSVEKDRSVCSHRQGSKVFHWDLVWDLYTIALPFTLLNLPEISPSTVRVRHIQHKIEVSPWKMLFSKTMSFARSKYLWLLKTHLNRNIAKAKVKRNEIQKRPVPESNRALAFTTDRCAPLGCRGNSANDRSDIPHEGHLVPTEVYMIIRVPFWWHRNCLAKRMDIRWPAPTK